MFDTFSGFDERDVSVEKEMKQSDLSTTEFSNTSVELVMSKMCYPENVEIHKGYFPETTVGVNDLFMFVNLDFDLYQPILEGLRFFWPKMIKSSVLLVHDYYHMRLAVGEAIENYEKEIGTDILKMPIGDNQSIALIKQ